MLEDAALDASSGLDSGLELELYMVEVVRVGEICEKEIRP